MKFSLSHLTIKRPVSTIMVLLMVVVLGISAMIGIPKDLMPKIELPVAMVMTQYSNASPDEVESLVTATVESALASVEGLDEMVSYSLEGSSIVLMTFKTDTDMNFATLNMREAISLVEDYLPDGVSKPMVLKLNLNSLPIMQIYVSADMPLEELNGIVKDNVVPYFERSKGVASVALTGGLDEVIAMEFSQESLTNFGLSLSAISQILMAENISLPSGEITKGNTKIIVRTVGDFESVEELRNMPLMVGDGSVVRLEDIANIERKTVDPKGITRIDGNSAIGIMVTKSSDANTVDASKALRKQFKVVQEKYPEISFVIGYDSADYINGSINNVAMSAIVGAALAIIVVFLFLRNVRSTLVIAISIPTSILCTFAAMDAFNITLNIVTLCSLTITVGMIVDNSIVVLENIYRVRHNYPSAEEASDMGAREVFMAVLASTVTTLMVFVPIAVSGGYAGMMFKEFCFTIIISLTASLIVALSVVPMLCSKLLKGNISTDYLRIGRSRYKYRLVPKFSKKIDELVEFYDGIIRKILTIKKRTLVTATCIFLASMVLLRFVPWELLPQTDEGSVNITVEMPYGSSLATQDSIMSQVEEYVLSLPEVDHAALSTESISALSLVNNSSFTLSLKPRSQRNRSAEEVAADIERHCNSITGAKIRAQSSTSILSMFGSADIQLYLVGKDNKILLELAKDLSAQLEKQSLVQSAGVDVTEGDPQVEVKLNRTTAAYYGVTAYQLASALSSSLNGTNATRVTIDGDTIDVKLSLTDYYSESVENMKQVVVTGNYGTPVTVGQIASFEFSNAPAYIGRYHQQRYVVINVKMAGGDLSKTTSQVNNLISNYPLPDGYYFIMEGIADTMVEVFGSLFKAILVAIALVFLILAAQFESVLMAFVVMMAVPYAMTGAFLALFLTGKSLCMTSLLGLVLLVGTVVNNSILLVEFINQNKDEMGVHEAIVAAGKLRMRPILMTTLTTVVGMIPLALGIGQGGEMMAPMAVSVIGGLIASTILTLIIIPCLYEIIDDRKKASAEKRAAKEEEIRKLEEKWRLEDAN